MRDWLWYVDAVIGPVTAFAQQWASNCRSSGKLSWSSWVRPIAAWQHTLPILSLPGKRRRPHPHPQISPQIIPRKQPSQVTRRRHAAHLSLSASLLLSLALYLLPSPKHPWKTQ